MSKPVSAIIFASFFSTTEITEITEAPKRGKDANFFVFMPRFAASVISVFSVVEKKLAKMMA